MVTTDSSTVKAKLHQIAAALPDGWAYQPATDSVWNSAGKFEGPDGMQVWLDSARHYRIEASGVMSRFRDVHFETVKIGFSLRRPVQVLARDIDRRLLKPYAEAYREAAERLAQHKADEQRREAILQELLTILGPGASKIDWTREYRAVYSRSRDDDRYASLDLKVNHSSVSFKQMSLSIPLAMEVCRLIAEGGK